MFTAVRQSIVILVLPLAALGCTAPPERPSVEPQARLFLDCVKNSDGNSAYALLSSDYLARLSDDEKKNKALKVPTWKIKEADQVSWGMGNATHPTNNEAQFQGSIDVLSDGQHRSYKFHLHLKHQMGWKVDLFTVETPVKK